MVTRFFELPESFYRCLERENQAVLLESSKPDQDEHQSWLFTEPVAVLRLEPGGNLADFLTQAERYQKGGHYLAGYIAYEAGYPLVGVANAPATPYPLAQLGVYRTPLHFNHLTGLAKEPDRQALGHQAPRLHDLHLDIDEQTYLDKIARIHAYLEAGDCYQVNFTDAYCFEFQGNALELYRKLKQAQRVPFGGFLRFDGLEILSLSPELFFKRQGDRLTTRPMKGTLPRGRTLTEDETQAERLAADPKSRAENVMIVDLLRNDLGRVCRAGSVQVPRLFEVERFESLLQMTSTVTGTLRPGVSTAELFAALFPCGSVTGAPKKRVMEIIHELEARGRGIYTGAIGYLAPNGDAAFNVAIRTLVVQNGQGVFGVGGGIVHDSRAEEEYAECRLKAHFLSAPQEPFELFETLRWEGGYPLLTGHLARLSDSASYFNFPFEPEEAERNLLELAAGLNPRQVYRVKLLLNPDGRLRLEPSPFHSDRPRSLEVAFAPYPTHSENRFLYHKTTRREAYEEASRLARAKSLADLIFVNERGEVTEGAISNLFIEREGRLLTPPVSSGLLPGVYRRHLLDTEPCAQEQVLRPPDLETADALYLCNALRGLRRVTLRERP